MKANDLIKTKTRRLMRHARQVPEGCNCTRCQEDRAVMALLDVLTAAEATHQMLKEARIVPHNSVEFSQAIAEARRLIPREPS